MKKILPLAIAAIIAAPTAAMADATVYGKVKVATNKWSQDNSYSGKGASSEPDVWEMKDESSRIGVKGSEDLGDGLKGIYKMEFGASVGNSFGGLSGRNAYVGLAGGFGTFLAGRHDHPLKMSTGKLDLFADTVADNDTGGHHSGLMRDLRADGAFAYVSPSFGGLTVAVALVNGNDSSYLTNNTDNFQDAYSLAAMYSNGPFYLSAAIDNASTDGTGLPDDYEVMRLGGGVLGMAGFTVTGIYETAEVGSVVDEEKYMLNAAYDLGAIRIMGGYGAFEDGTDATGMSDFDVMSLGVTYGLSKRTNVQGIYTSRSYEMADSDASVISFQINHSF